MYYTYDALNRMEYARENAINGTELAFYDYDPLSRREQLRFAATSGNRIDYTYEPDSNLDLLTNVLNTVTVTLNHGHNRAGQLNSIVANDDFYLPTPPVPSSTVYAANRLNQYGSIGGQNATHDLNGNLLTWFRNGVRQTYTYDAENRLLTAATDGTTTPSATYDYDALGRRVSKTGSGTTPTYFLLDGDEEIAEYSDTGVLQRRYIMGPAIDDRIARAETNAISNPPKTYYHINHQGSVIATANANGSIAQQLAYDEYGNLTSQAPAATTGEPFRYTGRRYDRETNLYYYRARYYSTELGRFLQVDPVGYRDDFNLYAYVRNDPLNLTDPTGTIAGVDDAIIIGGAVLIAGAATVACQPGSACNEGISDALTKTGDAIADAHQATVTAVVDAVERIEKAMEARQHKKGARPSTKGKHEKGQARKSQDRGGEKGDARRDPPRKRPPDHKGPWPPKQPSSGKSGSGNPASEKSGTQEPPKPCVPDPDGKAKC